jgi:hypothetical protein
MFLAIVKGELEQSIKIHFSDRAELRWDGRPGGLERADNAGTVGRTAKEED